MPAIGELRRRRVWGLAEVDVSSGQVRWSREFPGSTFEIWPMDLTDEGVVFGTKASGQHTLDAFGRDGAPLFQYPLADPEPNGPLGVRAHDEFVIATEHEVRAYSIPAAPVPSSWPILGTASFGRSPWRPGK